MKFSSLSDNLKKAVNSVERVVSAKTTLPVLNNILVEAKDGKIKVVATDLDMGVTYWLRGKVDQDGQTTVPVKLLSSYLSSALGGKIQIDEKDSVISVEADGSQATINGVAADEFPVIPQVKGTEVAKIETIILKDAIERTVFAAAKDMGRPVLTGVLMKFSGSQLTLVATDSFRLVEQKINLKTKAAKNIDVIVPARTLTELARVISDIAGEVVIIVSESQILFKGDDFEVISRLVDGEYPDYRQVMPKEFKSRSVMKVGAFNSGLRSTGLFSYGSGAGVKIKTDQKKGEVTISASSAEVGSGVSRIPAKIEGEDTEINFNAKYVSDVLSVIDSAEIALEINDKLSPGVIKPTNTENYLYIVMPLRGE